MYRHVAAAKYTSHDWRPSRDVGHRQTRSAGHQKSTLYPADMRHKVGALARAKCIRRTRHVHTPAFRRGKKNAISICCQPCMAASAQRGAAPKKARDDQGCAVDPTSAERVRHRQLGRILRKKELARAREARKQSVTSTQRPAPGPRVALLAACTILRAPNVNRRGVRLAHVALARLRVVQKRLAAAPEQHCKCASG